MKIDWIEPNHLAASGIPITTKDIHSLNSQGIRAIVSLTEQPITIYREITPQLLAELDMVYLHIPIPDQYAPDIAQAHSFLQFIGQMKAQGRPTLVHCHAGIGRTGTILHLYYLAQGATFEEAKTKVKMYRPQSTLLSERQKEFLEKFAATLIVENQSRLSGRIGRPANLTLVETEQMYTLMADYFVNLTRSHFEQDLAEKEWVVILADAVTSQIQGFSTLMRLSVTVDDQPVVAFFSGDTIIHRDYWGEVELPRLWGRHVFNLAETICAEARVFWFLISSGYKTYRFLPVFFREFYPTCRQPTPPSLKRILDALAQLKFPGEYDPASGIIRFAQAVPLRRGVAEVTERRLKDPHVAFFVAANPGHAQGDQLACLVELTQANLTPAGWRMLGLS
jgi:protein-tyrosine phosphatase